MCGDVMPRTLGKAHTTENYHRVVVSRRRCAPNSMRYTTASEEKGVKLLVCCPRGEFHNGRCDVGMETRTVLFPKDHYSKQQAESHAKQFR